MGESMETFYGDGNGREVAAKFLLTQLKLKMCSEDLSVRHRHRLNHNCVLCEVLCG
jgi:hypothetical protein